MMLFSYPIKFECDNCGHITTISIPKGKTITEFLAAERGRCRYCKCKKFKSFAKLKKNEETWFMIVNNELKGGINNNVQQEESEEE